MPAWASSLSPIQTFLCPKSTPGILALHVTYTPTYPDELPIIEIEQETESMEQMYHDKLMTEVTRVVSF